MEDKGRKKITIADFLTDYRGQSYVSDIEVIRSTQDPPDRIAEINSNFPSGVHFHNCGFSELKIVNFSTVKLMDCDVYGEVISNIALNGTHEYNGCELGSLKVVNGSQEGNLELTKTKIKEELHFNTSINSVSITTNSVIKKINQIGSLNQFQINQATVNELNLNNGSNYKLNGLKTEKVTIKRCNGDVMIGQDTKINQDLVIESSNIVTIDSSEIYNISIEETVCNEFKSKSSIFYYLSIKNVNDRSISFTDTIIKSLFTIYRSALVKTAFNRFSFDIDAKLDIQQSSITESKYYSIKWPHDFKVVEKLGNDISKEEKLKRLWDFREVYRQLKVVSLEFHNKLDAKKFQANELRSYYRAQGIETFGNENWFTQILKAIYSIVIIVLFTIIPVLPLLFLLNTIEEFPSGTFYRKIINYVSNFSNWLLLVTNKLFSDFGESYGLPLGWLIAIHFLFFWSLFDALNLQFGMPPDWDVTKKAFSLFLNLLSPIHGSEITDLLGNKISLSDYGIRDFFMRISSGYFIYYFIKATRKYNFSI